MDIAIVLEMAIENFETAARMQDLEGAQKQAKDSFDGSRQIVRDGHRDR